MSLRCYTTSLSSRLTVCQVSTPRQPSSIIFRLPLFPSSAICRCAALSAFINKEEIKCRRHCSMAASGGSKSAKNLDGRSPGAPEDSSESDGETEPAKSFHRRLSTNRDIKCSVCPKPASSVFLLLFFFINSLFCIYFIQIYCVYKS